MFTQSDEFGATVTFAAGSSIFESGFTPEHPVTMHWHTFLDAANQAWLSRRNGGIHFKAADLTGRAVGKVTADINWQKATSLWNGKISDKHFEAALRGDRP